MHPRNMSDEELLKNVLITTKEKISESTQELSDRFIYLLSMKKEYEREEQRLDDYETERDNLLNMVERAKQSIEVTNEILNEDY